MSLQKKEFTQNKWNPCLYDWEGQRRYRLIHCYFLSTIYTRKTWSWTTIFHRTHKRVNRNAFLQMYLLKIRPELWKWMMYIYCTHIYILEILYWVFTEERYFFNCYQIESFSRLCGRLGKLCHQHHRFGGCIYQ